MKALYQGGSGNHGVLPQMRHGGVAALAPDGDLKFIRGGHDWPDAGGDGAHGQIGPVVQGINRIHRKAAKQAVIHHGFGAATAFFGRLKNQVNRAIKIAVLRQILRCRQQGSGVAIVPAGVHTPRIGGGVGKLVVLLHGQGVHIGTQANGAAATAFLDHAHKPSFAQTAMHGDAPRLQFFSNQGAGAFFSKTQFGVGVDVAA